jgi:hypothetical protein
LRSLRDLAMGARAQMREVLDDEELKDLTRLDQINPSTTTIIDMDGNPQTAYDVSEINALRAKPVNPDAAE